MSREATNTYEILPYSGLYEDGWSVYKNGEQVTITTFAWQARRFVRTLRKNDKASN